MARDRRSYDDLWRLAEDLLTNDETAAQWRAGHVQTVQRQIGTRSGTDGSTGKTILGLFDADKNCSVTVEEIKTNSLIVSLLSPDVTINGTMALSLGIKATAVKATYTQP